MTIQEIAPILDSLAPLAYAEDFDNVGFLTQHQNPVTGILVCHDALESVIQEAIEKKCNLVVCFHPILFSSIKKITGKNYVERAIIKAIKHDIAIYAVHTALDNHQNGVNNIFCNALGVINTKILIPKENYIEKLVTYAPINVANTIRKALFEAGAGQIGNYSDCSFVTNGIGSYKGNEISNPTIGIKNSYHEEAESKIEVIYEKHLQTKILKSLKENHSYEEVAYEIYSIKNKHQNIGLGMIGELQDELSETAFLQFVKEKMQCGGIKHSELLNKKIKKVAVLGGSGSFAIPAAIAKGADVLLTSDLKYHDYYQAEKKIVLVDIGHYESERFTKNYISDFLIKEFNKIESSTLKDKIIISQINTNPVNYFN